MRIGQRATLSGTVLLVTGLLGISYACLGQGVEEVIVTGSRSDEGGLPGTFLRKTGDFLLLQFKLKDFTAGVKEVGRTRLEASGSVDISIVSPHRYREETIALYAAAPSGAVEHSLGRALGVTSL
jgi:hypothetical protein